YDRTVREALARLVGVVDGAIDAIAEAELAGEMHGQASGGVAVLALLDGGDEFAVIALGQRPGDFVLEIEPFSEDQRRQGTNGLPMHAASDRRAAAAPPLRAHRWPSRSDSGTPHRKSTR